MFKRLFSLLLLRKRSRSFLVGGRKGNLIGAEYIVMEAD